MSKQYEKLKTLLKELFQLDQPDLDFGLYRIMHAKSAEVSQFLDQDLLPQVKGAFALYKTADKAEIEKELTKVVAGIEAAGMDPGQSPKVVELRERLANEAVDLGRLESEVYDHLFSFFRRYYSEGDFLSKRVYKPGVYAIPYEGEEVKLHWANADQYYIKTSEYLRDYAFRLRPDDEAKPMRVHFRLVDVAEGEHGNVKATAGKDRRFKLAETDALAYEDDELIVRFTYQPDLAKQKDLNAAAEEALLATDNPTLANWITALSAKHLRADGTESDNTRLRVHLDRYTARNTFDYFIHKDLGGFLRRELDFYIKNEVMHLDDIENESVPRVEQYLSKIKVIRKIAGKIIDFLAQLEDFQKKLWLKKKFVVETSWCIRVGCIPEKFYEEIAANHAQEMEWVELLSIDEIEGELTAPGYAEGLTRDFLKGHPTLVVDTQYFDSAFTARLLDAIGELDAQADGVLFHSENFQALTLMRARYQEQVTCIYIDPPYNAKSSEILYKNDYQHSSWLSLMDGRLGAAHSIMHGQSTLVVAIDEVEQERLGQLLSLHFPDLAKDCVVINHNPSGQQGDNFSFTHEYAYFVHQAPGRFIAQQTRGNPADWDERNFRDVTGDDSLRSAGKNCFYPIFVNDNEIVGFGDVCADDFHPQVNELFEDGTIAVFPVDPEGIERKWRFARDTVEGIKDELKVHKLEHRGIVDIKRLKKTFNYKSNWTDARYSANNHGTQLLNHIIPKAEASYPKSIYSVQDCVHAALNGSLWGSVADYFAGSGTTGHATINLNREDGGQRKFILVEMGDHFETVLLPRLKKVTFTPEWKNGKPKRLATPEEAENSPCIMKVVRLESYEDTLNNLETRRSQTQEQLLLAPEAQGADNLKEQYVLRYMLDVETRGSQSLLNVAAFSDPTAYTLKVKTPGSDESREINVDLLETFNWLIGLTVKHIAAPQTFSAAFERDEEKRLRLNGRLKLDVDGKFWFRIVTGTTPDGRRTLVIWRKLTGNPEDDNLVLEEWFTKQGYSAKDSEFDLIYVNGGNNLENLKTPDDLWKVRLIEEDFHRLMFESEGV